MNEIINSILEAEKKADAIITDASLKARVCISEAEANAEKIKENAIVDFKKERKTALIDAEKRADEEYEKILQLGKESALLNIKKAEEKVQELSAELIGRITF